MNYLHLQINQKLINYAKNVDLEYLIKTNETLIGSIRTIQQSFIEQQDSNEVQSSKYTSNITN